MFTKYAVIVHTQFLFRLIIIYRFGRKTGQTKKGKTMNVNAIESMENLAQTLLTMNDKSRNDFYKRIEKNVGHDEMITIMKAVTLYDMLTNPAKYKAIQEAVGQQIYNEFNQ